MARPFGFDPREILRGSGNPAAAELLKELDAAERLIAELDPLESLVFTATVLDDAHRQALGAAGADVEDLGALLVDVADREPLRFTDGRPKATGIEDAGVLGAILWMNGEPGWTGVFVNDLARRQHGIDLAARHEEGRRWLVEAKGTTRAVQSPGRYLKGTRRKGRQLSWEWCWSSLVEFAQHPPSARLFLESFEDLLEGATERVLTVTRTEREGGGYVLLGTETFGEAELGRIDGLADRKSSLDGWRGRLRQLRSPAGRARQERLAFVGGLYAVCMAASVQLADDDPGA